MKRFYRSLWLRLVASYLVVVLIAVFSTALLGRSVAGGFFEDHLEDMARDAGAMDSGHPPVFEDLRRSFSASFRESATIAITVSGAVALAAGGIAAVRLLRPLRRIRRATRRMAGGAYSERVPIPVESELADLVEDVNALGSALERVEERRIRLISEVAHELRTPLSTIEGYMEGLLDGVFEPTEEVFAVTAREAARLKRLASDLSALSAAEAGSIDLRREPLDLGRIAAETAERLRPQYEAQEVGLRVSLDDPLPVVGDPDRLRQVFTNIIGNALAHSHPGDEVVVAAIRESGRAVVRVTDTGTGLTPEQTNLVFERFYRVDGNLRRGVGIGLTIARRLARLHEGEVTADSAGLGQGATFTVELPLARSGSPRS